MRTRPGQSFGKIARSGFPCDHGKFRNSHQRLKIGRDDAEVRRAVIVGMNADADSAETLQERHSRLSFVIVQ